MGRILREVERYAPRLYPVRGVCIDGDDQDQPQDVAVEPAKVKPGMLAERDAGTFPVRVGEACRCGSRGYARDRSLCEYFLDGTRRTYLVAEMESSTRRYLPILGAQISAAVMRRDRATGRVSVFAHELANLVAVPGGGIGINQGDVDDLQARLSGSRIPVRVIAYGERGIPETGQPADLAVAKINESMQSLEVNLLERLTNENRTSASSMLVVDGSVQFTKIPLSNRSWLRYVVGVSKTYRTNLRFTKDKKEIGALLVERLRQVGDRTVAFKLDFRSNAYAVWYLRIRERRHVDKPLSGIIKIERLLLSDEDLEFGLSTDAVNNISASLLGEKYVTPYGKDERWPNHLYPVYLAERFQKSRLLGEMQFLRLF